MEKIADKIIIELANPFQVLDYLLNISGSIGIPLIPQDSTNSEVLISYADKAMYEAKRKGRNQYKFFAHPSGL